MSSIDFFLKHWQDSIESVSLPPERLIACLDLTSLNADDDAATITQLCQLANTHEVAAVCVAPAFVSQAKHDLGTTGCQLATVANFPSGALPLSVVLKDIEASVRQGATEIDVVVPYQQFLMDHHATAITRFVKACKAECGPSVRLKTILESGLIEDQAALERLALAALEGGADFLKTSTGKVGHGASLEAAAIMLGAIKAFDDRRGFKASGGVKTYQQAKAYWLLATVILGELWPSAEGFRLGASSLLNELLLVQGCA